MDMIKSIYDFSNFEDTSKNPDNLMFRQLNPS